MKKVFISLIIVALAMGSVCAKPVDAGTARRVAETWMNAKGMKNTASLSDVSVTTPFTEFYVFASPEGGFILVSADDCVVPVLGYSVDRQFNAKNLPDNMREVLEGYEGEIRFWKQQAATLPSHAQSPVATQWQMLTEGQVPPEPLTTAVSALVSTTWNQSPYYNALCPTDENEGGDHHLVTGCVATATAQIMKYYNHPTTGYGSHSYNHSTYGNLSANFGNTTYQWSNMPNALTSSSSTAEVNAVATLMYHVGVADEMSYGLSANGGSGAYNYNYFGELEPSSQTSLMEYFKYCPDMAAVARDNYSDSQYCAILRAELDESRPILYSGFGGGGHSFVVDGYNASGQFHVNWGWGGSHDGYFTMGSLNPSGSGTGGSLSGTYNIDNVALVNIRPNTNWNTTTTITASVEGCSSATVTGAGTYAFGDTVTLYVSVPEGYRFARWNDYDRFNSRQTYANGGTYNFTAFVEPVAGNIRSYCGDYCNNVTSFSSTNWGIRLPSSTLSSSDTLSAVQVFVSASGTYTLKVYTGTTSPTTVVYTDSRFFTSYDKDKWKTFLLSTPLSIDPSQNLWITFNFNGSGYPAAVTSSCGNQDGFLSGSSLTPSTYYNRYTVMVRGIFGDASSVIDSSDIVDCSQPATAPYALVFNRPEFSNQIACWSFYDADGDGNNWYIDGDYFTSRSWNSSALTPDNWLISPAITLPSGSNYTLTFKDAANDISWPSEHYGVFVSTSGTDVSDFTLLQAWTLTDTNWTLRSIDLGSYAGQTVHIAFRHYDCTDMFSMHLKDIKIDAIASLPYSTGFENGDDVAWELNNGTNGWFVGSAVSNSGSKSLYISNDEGASNAYTITISTVSYASRKFNLESGEYAFSFDWHCNGESNYDFLRVWAVPNDADFMADVFPDVSPYTTGTPEGWIDLVNGKLNGNGNWSTANGTFNIANAGIYKLVFCWKNDGSVGSNPAAAIDNVSITALSCPSPTNLAISTMTSNSISITWDANSGSQWLVRLDGGAWQPVGTTSFTASGLAPATSHTFDVRTLCGAGDTSLVVSVYAATTCEALLPPFNEGFEGLTDMPLCWSTSGNGTWVVGTGDYSGSTGAAAGSKNIKITHGTTGDVTYLISPVLDLSGLESAVLTFQHVQRSWSGDIDELTIQYRTSSTATWQTIASYTAAFPTWTEETISLTNLSSTYQIAFVYTDHYGYGVGLDEISITGTSSTQEPDNFTVTAIPNDATMGTVTGGGTYEEGTVVTLTATPNAGYHLVSWSTGDTINPLTITVTSDITVIATFDANPVETLYTVTATANDATRGTVTGGGTYNEGETATLTAIPQAGYSFLGWDNGALANPYSFPVNANVSVVAQFSLYGSDTILLHDSIYFRDTVYQQQFIHDTLWLYDSIYIHDTTIIDHYIYDTGTVVIFDTVIIDHYIHDTTIIDHYIYDTGTVVIFDTIINTVHDTTVVTNTEYVYDTTVVTDTLWLTQHDTIIIHDTIVIHDTLYVGVDEVEVSSVKLYQRDGCIVVEGSEGHPVHLYDAVGRMLAVKQDNTGDALVYPVVNSGVYLVKVGDAPARRIVVIR